MFSYLLIFVSVALSACWSFPFIVFTFFGWQIYKTTDQRVVNYIQKTLKPSSSISNDGNPFGFFYGKISKDTATSSKFYFGNICETAGEKYNSACVYILCSNLFYKEIEGQTIGKAVKSTVEKQYSLWSPFGNVHCFRYSETKAVLKRPPTKDQSDVIDQIKKLRNTQGGVVVCITGPTGTGKTETAFQLAQDLGCHIITGFDPFSPNMDLAGLKYNVHPSQDKPLIVVINEFDVNLNLAIEGKVPLSDVRYPSIYDKRTWNDFMDDVHRPHNSDVIFILTSNVKINEYIKKIDPSLLNKNRVNFFTEMQLPIL